MLSAYEFNKCEQSWYTHDSHYNHLCWPGGYRLKSAQTPFDKFTEYTRTANLSNVHISEKSMKCLSLLKYKLFTQPQISNNLHALFEKFRVSTHTPTLHTHTCTHWDLKQACTHLWQSWSSQCKLVEMINIDCKIFP